MGATVSGSEIDEWKEPSDESYILCKKPNQYPKKDKRIKIEFVKGEAKKIIMASYLKEQIYLEN